MNYRILATTDPACSVKHMLVEFSPRTQLCEFVFNHPYQGYCCEDLIEQVLLSLPYTYLVINHSKDWVWAFKVACRTTPLQDMTDMVYQLPLPHQQSSFTDPVLCTHGVHALGNLMEDLVQAAFQDLWNSVFHYQCRILASIKELHHRAGVSELSIQGSAGKLVNSRDYRWWEKCTPEEVLTLPWGAHPIKRAIDWIPSWPDTGKLKVLL